MANCITPNGMLNALSKEDRDIAIERINSLMDILLRQDEEKYPYKYLFVKTNESYDDLEDSTFEYRAKMFATSWYLSNVDMYVNEDDAILEFNKILNTTPYSSPNVLNTEGIPKSQLKSIITSIAVSIASNPDVLDTSGYEIIKDKVVGHIATMLDSSGKNVTLSKELNRLAIMDDLEREDSYIYSAVVSVLAKEYGINIKGKVELDVVESVSETDDDVLTQELIFSYSDSMTIDYVKKSMSNRFKIELIRIMNTIVKGDVDYTYVPSLLTANQIVNKLLQQHISDRTITDMVATIANLAKLDNQYSHLYNALIKASNVDFRNAYYRVFSKAIMPDTVMDISKRRTDVSNAQCMPTYQANNILTNGLENHAILQGILDVTEGIINPTDDEVSIVLTNIAAQLGIVMNGDIPAFTKASTFIQSIRDYAGSILYKNANAADLNLEGRSLFVRAISKAPSIYIKTQYLNFEGESVQAVREGSYLSRFLKGLIPSPVYVKGGIKNTVLSNADRSRIVEVFEDVINDPMNASNPFIHDKGVTAMSLFTTIDGSTELNSVEALEALANLQMSAAIKYRGINGNDITVAYKDIQGSVSALYYINSLLDNKYIVPNSDATTSYTIDVPAVDASNINGLLLSLVTMDIDAFNYGLAQSSKGTLYDTNRFGRTIESLTGSAYKFKDSSVDIFINNDIKSITYRDFINSIYSITHVDANGTNATLTDEMILTGMDGDTSILSKYFTKDSNYIKLYVAFMKRVTAMNATSLSLDSDLNVNFEVDGMSTSVMELLSLITNVELNASTTVTSGIMQTYNDAIPLLEANGILINGKDASQATLDNIEVAILNPHYTQMVWGATYNSMIAGRQSEFKDSNTLNKRVGQASRKSEGSNKSMGSPNYKVGVFNSVKSESPVAESLAKLYSKDGSDPSHIYDKHNATDGISYITEKTFKRFLQQRGLWEDYKDVYNALNSGEFVSPKKYAKMAEQLKHFAYARRKQSDFMPVMDDGSVTGYQFKDSTEILFRSKLEGTQWADIYDFMELNELSQLSSRDALKVGYVNSITIHGENGTVKDGLRSMKLDDSNGEIIHMYISDFGTQQDVSSHVQDKDTTLGSQFFKKMIADLAMHLKVYPLTMNGKTSMVTGKEVFDGVQRIHQSITNRGMDSLMQEFGAIDESGTVKDSDGTIAIDKEVYKERLLELARQQDMAEGVTSILESDVEGNNAIMSLPIIANSFEDLIVSRFNKVLRKKLPGTHVTIVPDVFRSLTAKPETDSTANDGDVENTSIVQTISSSRLPNVLYSPSFLKDVEARGGDFRLREEYAEDIIDKDGNTIEGRILKAEIIISPTNSDILKYASKTVIAADGSKVVTIDFDKISDECLEMIGIRIPTDSKASAVAFKIVGFLTDGSSKAVVPTGLINRTGWDFDIDTIYTYHKNSKLDDNGNIVAINRDNAYSKSNVELSKFEAWLTNMIPSWRSDIDAATTAKLIDMAEESIEISDNFTLLTEFQSNFINLNHADIIESIEDAEAKFKKRNSIKALYLDILNDSIELSRSGAIVLFEEHASDALKAEYGSRIFEYMNKVTSLYNRILTLDSSLLSTIPFIFESNETYKGNYIHVDENGNRLMLSIMSSIESLQQSYVSERDSHLIKDGVIVHPYYKTFSQLSDIDKQSIEVIQNELLDYYFSILLSKHHVKEKLRSNSSANIFAASKDLKIESSLDLNTLAAFGRYYYQSANMSIGGLKGLSVSFDGHFAQLQTINAFFRNEGVVRKITNDDIEGLKYTDGFNSDGTPIVKDGSVYTLDSNGKVVLNNDYISFLGRMFKATPTIITESGTPLNGDVIVVNIEGSNPYIIIKGKHIANNPSGTFTMIDGSSLITDQIAEWSPSIFDSVNRPFSTNINKYTIDLVRTISSSVVGDVVNGKMNSAKFALSLVEHPYVKMLVQQCSTQGSKFQKLVSNALEDIKKSKSIVHADIIEHVMSSSELVKSAKVPYESMSDDDRLSILVMLDHYLNLAGNIATIGAAMRPEKPMRGAYSAIKFKTKMYDTIANINNVTRYNTFNIIKRLMQIHPSQRGILSNVLPPQIIPTSDNRSNEIANKYKAKAIEVIKNAIRKSTTVDDYVYFINANPIIIDIISNPILTLTPRAYDGFPSPTPVAQALYPSAFVGSDSLIEPNESSNPTIESNFKVQSIYDISFGSVSLQHHPEFKKILTEVLKQYDGFVPSDAYTSISNAITNHVFAQKFDIRVPNESASDLSSNIYLTDDMKRSILDIKVDKDTKANNSKIVKSVKDALIGLKQEFAEKGLSLYSMSIFNTLSIQGDNTSYNDMYKTLAEFYKLPISDKWYIVQQVFKDVIDSNHVMHPTAARIVRHGEYSYIGYNSINTEITDIHTISFEQMYNSDNEFVSNLAKDMVVNNWVLNGANYGNNIGRVIPISTYLGMKSVDPASDSYSNTMGTHPAETISRLANYNIETLTTNMPSVEQVLDAYVRQTANPSFISYVKKALLDKYSISWANESILEGGLKNITEYSKIMAIPNAVLSAEGLSNKPYVKRYSKSLKKHVIYKAYPINQFMEMASKDSKDASLYTSYYGSDTTVFIPMTPLLKNEYDDVSFIKGFNIYYKELDGGITVLTASELANKMSQTLTPVELIDHITYSTLREIGAVKVIDGVETPYISIAQYVGFRAKMLEGSLDTLAVENSNTESAAIVDEFAELYSTDTFESYNTVDQMSDVDLTVQAVSDIESSHSSISKINAAIRLVANKRSSLQNKEITKLANEVYNIYLNNDLLEPRNLYGWIENLSSFVESASNELQFILKRLSELDGIDMYKNENADLSEFANLLARAKQLISVLKETDSLNPEMLAVFDKGHFPTTIGDTMYAMVHDIAVFNANDVDIPVIANESDYTRVKSNDFIEILRYAYPSLQGVPTSFDELSDIMVKNAIVQGKTISPISIWSKDYTFKNPNNNILLFRIGTANVPISIADAYGIIAYRNAMDIVDIENSKNSNGDSSYDESKRDEALSLAHNIRTRYSDIDSIITLMNEVYGSEYTLKLENNLDFAAIKKELSNVTKVYNTNIKPVISSMEVYSDRLAHSILASQSKLYGIEYDKLVSELVSNGIESDKDIDISAESFKRLVNRLVDSENKSMRYVNHSMRNLGSPLVSTNPTIDSVLNQYHTFRHRNRTIATDYESRFNALYKEYNISDNDSSIFGEYGNLVTRFDYFEIDTAKRKLYKSLGSLRAAAKNKEITRAKFRSSRIEIYNEYFKSIGAYIGSEGKFGKKGQEVVTSTLTRAIDRLSESRYKSDEDIYAIMHKLKDELSSIGAMTVSYNAILDAKDKVSNRNSNIYSTEDIESAETLLKQIDSFDPSHRVRISNGEDSVYVYYRAVNSSAWDALDSSKQTFITKYNALMKEAMHELAPSKSYRDGDVAFINKNENIKALRKFIGYNAIVPISQWNDLSNNPHYLIDIDGMFAAKKYRTFNITDISVIDANIDPSFFIVQAFKKWYLEQPSNAKIAFDLDRLVEINGSYENAIDAIEQFNADSSIKNDAFKKENNSHNLRQATDIVIAKLVEHKTVKEMDNLVSATNITTSGYDNGVVQHVNNALFNFANQSAITSKTDRTISVIKRITSMTMMWGNYTSGIKNLISGSLHLYEEASKNGMYSAKDLKDAMTTFATHIVPNIKWFTGDKDLQSIPSGMDKDAALLFSLFDDYYQDVNDTSVSKGVGKYVSWVDSFMYSPNTAGEVIMQYSMVMANAKSHKVYRGKIMSYADIHNQLQSEAFKNILTTSQFKEYQAFDAEYRSKRSTSLKYISPINTSINAYIQSKLSDKSENALTKEQRDMLLNPTIDYNGNSIKLSDVKKEWDKLPSVIDMIDTSRDVPFIKIVNGKPAFSETQMTSFLRRVGEINRSIQGSYNAIDKSYIQQSAIGELFLQFRKWMYPTYARYFGRHWMKHSWNEGGGYVESPIFKPIADILRYVLMNRTRVKLSDSEKNTIRKSFGNIMSGIFERAAHLKSFVRAMNTNDKISLDKSIKTMGITVSLGVITMLVAGLIDDEDEEEMGKLLATVQYITDGIFNEWSVLIPVYGWYSEAMQLKNKLIVAETQLVAIGKIAYYLGAHAVASEGSEFHETLYYKTGVRKGESKLAVQVQKALPFVRQIEKQMYVEEYQNFYKMTNVFMK